MVTSPGTQRQVDTPHGAIRYTLLRKRVKRLNLRIDRSGSVVLTVPWHCTTQRAEEFLISKSGWVTAHLARLERETVADLPPEPPRAICQDILRQAVNRVYPLVELLGVAMPELKVRRMRSQWGNCHWNQGYITLNLALARCPEELRDYVALHELVHFLHHDHGTGFYARMDALMPDWRMRRQQLRGYGGALEHP